MVINLIIDHDKVHQQIFIIINNNNNNDKCVQIQIQKQKFAITVKHSFFCLLFFIYSLSFNTTHITIFFFYYPCLPYSFPMIDLFHFSFDLSFRLCNDDVRLFFTIFRQRVLSLIHIYIYTSELQLFGTIGI
jgi:hypothetical protein